MNHHHGDIARRWAGRIEDGPLLRGEGRFTDNLKPDNAAAACFVRSPHAFATIRSVEAASAIAMPGVLTVLTATDLAACAYRSVSAPIPIPGRGGRPPIGPHRPVLAGDRVHHVGEPVALVIADTLQIALDAAEQVAVDYEPLASVTDGTAALADGAPLIWPEAPGNVAFDWAAPADPDGSKAAAIERIMATAAHVVRVDLVNQRLVAASLEPRTVTADYDAAADRLTLRCGTQGVAPIRDQVAAIMGLPPAKLRVLTDDVGGGFGMKASVYPEYVALLHAARHLRRPVHWVSTRSEAFLSDNQGRDSVWTAALALDADGRFLALQVDGVAGIGAYTTLVAAFCATTHIAGCLPAVYDIPHAMVRSRCVFTNTVPIGPYRGAGRPEANYLIERLIDEAARQTGIDRAELRRRNLVAADRIPYVTAFGHTYDSGDFLGVLDEALAAADYAGFAGRRAQSERAGRLRGIGIGCYLEIAGAYPKEMASIAFPGGEQAVVGIGAAPSGQAHVSVFGAVAAQRLGVAPGTVTVRYGDSDRDVPGFGAVASRSAMLVGGAIALAIDGALAKGERVARLLMQAVGEEAVRYREGFFEAQNPPRRIPLFEVAARARELVAQGTLADDLDTTAMCDAPQAFPNGCHIAEVEIDPETGRPTVASYVAVDDCGKVLDDVIVAAQIHGGVAQGLGQALTEATVYDPADGQLLSGSFMDYAMPRAEDMPDMTVLHHPVPCTTNPLGTKGTGEAGTTAAPPAIINAILDALPPGARIDMPATPERIWRALKGQ